MDIFTEAAKIKAISDEDDKKDDDGDGVADVDQIDPKELLMRKTRLIITKCEPGKINTAAGGLYMSWIAVVATLKVQFARTIALALSIADLLQKPCDWLVAPAAFVVVPTDYHKWVPVVLGWICKSAAMSIAWYIQRIISALTSAIRGGLMCTRALVKFAYRRGWKLGGLICEDDEDTYIDEVAGFLLAFLGFYFQWYLGFYVPFPLNLILFPFEMAESYIQWTITSRD